MFLSSRQLNGLYCRFTLSIVALWVVTMSSSFKHDLLLQCRRPLLCCCLVWPVFEWDILALMSQMSQNCISKLTQVHVFFSYFIQVYEFWKIRFVWKETWYAFYFYFFSFLPFLFSFCMCAYAYKRSKSTPTEARLSHMKHCSWNTASVYMNLRDIPFLIHRV